MTATLFMKQCVKMAAILLACTTGTMAAADETNGIETLFSKFVQAWNQHDVRAFAQLFAPDADLTNWRGQHVRGRAAIEERYQPLFSGPVFRDSIVSAKVRMIRFLRPDIAIVDIDWEMTGARSVDGTVRPKRLGLLDWVCEKQDRVWRIVAFHDTDFTAASITVK